MDGEAFDSFATGFSWMVGFGLLSLLTAWGVVVIAGLWSKGSQV